MPWITGPQLRERAGTTTMRAEHRSRRSALWDYSLRADVVQNALNNDERFAQRTGVFLQRADIAHSAQNVFGDKPTGLIRKSRIHESREFRLLSWISAFAVIFHMRCTFVSKSINFWYYNITDVSKIKWPHWSWSFIIFEVGTLFVVRFLANVTTLRSLYAITIPSVVCRLSVCNVGAPYSAGWNFWQFFPPYDSSWTLV